MKNNCKLKLQKPEAAGASSWEQLKEKARKSPHLRPCPKYKGWWIYRTTCKGCENNIE